MSQLSFPFQNYQLNCYSEEDFLLLEENSAAMVFLKKFFAQEEFLLSRFPAAILKGPQYSGKTHLLQIFAQKKALQFLSEEEISKINLADFFAKNHFYIVENIDSFKDEKALFHLLNAASEAQAFLILTVREVPQFLLKDLNSRLKNIFTVEIKNPSLEAVQQLLVNGFARRQIRLSNKLIELISQQIERNYEAIISAIRKVEFFCAENGKNIAMKDLKQMF